MNKNMLIGYIEDIAHKATVFHVSELLKIRTATGSNEHGLYSHYAIPREAIDPWIVKLTSDVDRRTSDELRNDRQLINSLCKDLLNRLEEEELENKS